MDSIMCQPKDYGPALYLALNHAAGNLEIFDYFYMEEHDTWYVDVNDHGDHICGFALEGCYVRSCYEAVKRGITSWSSEA